MSVAEMGMLRGISGNTMKDMLRNEEIRSKLGVTPYWWENEGVAWDVIIMCKGKRLMRQWGRVG